MTDAANVCVEDPRFCTRMRSSPEKSRENSPTPKLTLPASLVPRATTEVRVAGNGWTSPEFYELGLFQTPAGLHGRCTGRHWRSCAIEPPGEENPRNPSPWARNCARIGADPAQWTNPTTQVRVGLLDLEDGAIALRRDFPELFPSPGSDWDLRMAVLYRFSRGGGYARSFLSGYRRELAAMPEAQRWNFLRDKTATATVTVKGKRVTVRRDFKGENVEEKMALAGKLGYVPRTA